MPDRVPCSAPDPVPHPRWSLRPLAEADRSWMEAVLTERWAGPEIVSRGTVHDLLNRSGFVVERARRPLGLATFHIEGVECQLTSLDALVPRLGVGTALLTAVVETARQAGCRRVWLITTNDNVDGLRFYQRRGFRLVAVYPNALARSRELKPSIPRAGRYAIPLRDEIELELRLVETHTEP
jgi:ribosomal protein S18 acetylase RimI-like enzyme